MDQPVEKTVFAPRSSGGASATDLFNTGDVVGQYKIEKVLGAGGMGVVYLAQHIALQVPGLPPVVNLLAVFPERSPERPIRTHQKRISQ